MNSIPVSVVILTHNEDVNIEACLDSLSLYSDVCLLDSGSTDRTTELAQARNIPVYANPFSGFGTQRNWAIDHIPTQFDWQFHLDADERMTPELAAELAAIVQSNPANGGYLVPSKLMFHGRWLKRSGQYPGYQVRFFHKDRLRFIDYGHGQREDTQFPIGVLGNPLIHYGFSKGIDEWFAKHIKYARREAEQAFSPAARQPDGQPASGAVKRRRMLKRMAMRLPGRYFLRLFYMLFIKRAILDGWAGVTYAKMLATYEGMIEVYSRLLRRGIKP